ncbi:HAMP domain-containing sensor histidine kinase [Myxococcus faecalis]|jgi:signal transduction histidine kinase|uniref:sensor histidine kinase n=1 Tax=Myxococcus TaxID=32 RepID=UPI001CBBD078|nr:HAMP domain-containing sensor histidine kinase [Myxococcus sp. XM-1-1-1]MBZ4406982.1 HAMP domain-containing histidine kinase [Myxococcus sp. XM-1-1-1]
MIRSWRVWLAVSACLALALAGVVWLSVFALRLDRADRQARLSAAREENVRLALWRLDSELLPLVARESAVPAEAYAAVAPVPGVLDARNAPLPEGQAWMASPLLAGPPEHVLLHFQVDTAGNVTSPQVIEASLRASLGVAPPRVGEEVLRARLEHVSRQLGGLRLREALAARDAPASTGSPLSRVQSKLSSSFQELKNASEYDARSRSARQAASQNVVTYQAQEPSAARASPRAEMRALWVGDALLLGRLVRVDGQEVLQGCWLDWPGLSRWLQGRVEDLLPGATLEPARGDVTATGEGRLLAALPVRLVPGSTSGEEGSSGALSSLPLVLMVAWSGVALAGVAVVALLVGVMALSERRGAFVSAVTHELRTPLTTFRMYTEMLSAGMVPDAARRQEYFDILHREAERLSHLVENVLAYARIERGRAPARLEPVAVDALVSRLEPRLAERALQSGLVLSVDVPPDVTVLTDPSAVEQVLFNLVDNASKYAAGATDPRLHLELERRGRRVGLVVRDHGPGVDPATARRLFEPFSKSVQAAARSAPGVGLGLALCRQLARSMRGELRYTLAPEGGARFVLWLPTA